MISSFPFIFTVNSLFCINSKVISFITSLIDTLFFAHKTFNFKYSDIKDINIKYEFIDKDIITSIQKIKLLLKNNFNNGSDLEDIPKVRSVDYVNQKIIYYLSNDNKKIPDLNIVIKEFMLLSNELIKKYELMVKYRNEDVEYKYNIRALQPYIINLVSIRKCLLDIYKEY